ncbi:PQQ-binding-like beta-propeller repeat protein [Halobacteriaceae archaeon GCM10025711]
MTGTASDSGTNASTDTASENLDSLDWSGWSMDGGGPGHARAATWTTGPDGKPSVAWSFEPEWDADTVDASEPAVVDGTVYAGLTRRDAAGSGDITGGTVVALDAADGSTQWEYYHDCGGIGTPAVVDGSVYVGTTDGQVHALDATNGKPLWKQEVASDTPASRVTVADDTVYVSGDSTYALDAASGQVRWETDALVRPSLWDGSLFGYRSLGEGEYSLVAVDAAAGAELWSVTLSGAGTVLAPPAVRGGTVVALVEGADETHAFDAADGTRRWEDAGDGPVLPAVDQERVYGAYTYGPPVHAHDAETGEEGWSTEKVVVNSLAVAGGTVYVTREPSGSEPVLEALGATSGAERWRLTGQSGEIAVADGGIYLAGDDGITALQ